jgi:hypothetical protein
VNGEHAGSGIDMREKIAGNWSMNDSRLICHPFICTVRSPRNISDPAVVCPTTSAKQKFLAMDP